MKNITLTLCLFLVATVTTFAQSPNVTPLVEQVSTDLSRSMTDDLALNEEEYIKLKTLNQERLSNATEAAKLYADDEAMRISRLSEIEADYEEKLFKMLNGRQVVAYEAFKVKPEASFVSLVQKISAQKR